MVLSSGGRQLAEPGSLQNSWYYEDRVYFEYADPVNDSAEQIFPGKQLKLDLKLSPDPEPFSGLNERSSKDASALEPQRSLIREQVERIHHLEKALDQSLASLAELRLQLVDQEFLEAQLASTEEISNIQQKAIAQLKHQLAQQQQTLDNQQNQIQSQNLSFQALLATVEGLAEGQQDKLGQLKAQLLSDRIALKHHFHAHALAQSPTESLGAPTDAQDSPPQTDALRTQDIIQELNQQLNDRQIAIEQLETELSRAHIALQEQQALIDSLQQAHAARRSLNESPLDGELFVAQSKIQELETQLSRQATNYAMLQHACQELEQVRDRYQNRATELEQQTAEMQEQILKQAQQASEYETAVQHWKDRYSRSQDYLNHLKTLIEQTVDSPAAELLEVLAQIHANANNAESDLTHMPNAQGLKMDVPDFLARRQRYRTRH